ncbi:hypothetical protein ACKVWM_011666 [Pyricularia oryzae]
MAAEICGLPRLASSSSKPPMREANDDISLLAALKGAKFEASLVTTFNATLPFYEEVVLRRLQAADSRHNVVLMDAVQCARSWATPSLRPRLAGWC